MIINNVQFTADLEDILAELQAQLKLNNIELLQTTKNSVEDVMVACPYHKNGQERRPSAGIRKSDGKFHCFTCGAKHELQEVVSFCFGHYDDVLGSFGWKWLLKNFATINVEERKDIQIDCFRRNMGVSSNNTANAYVSDAELERYRYYHPYMFRRKLTKAVIDLFDIGWDSDTDCITFPVKDIDGNCLFIARRSTQFKYFNYPKGVEKPLYGLYEYNRVKGQMAKNVMFMRAGDLNWGNEVIICESMIDALTCWVYGKPAFALNGLGSERQFRELRELPCRKLVLATDADSAGMEARERIRANVKNKLITEYIWNRKEAKDINDMTKEMFMELEEVF